MHDLLSCFEEHTVYDKTTNKKGKKVDPSIIGAESYQDKVGADEDDQIWNQDLENM